MDNTDSTEKLLAEIVRLKNELKKNKKYGLVWEDKTEDVVEMCKEKLPVLKEVKDKEIKTDPNKPTNIIIEGDNYHALSVLNYTHKGKIDVIYIDPPYNTGAKDWKYNNSFVDSNDTYRHSKWICMMYHRVKIAKNLLNQNGILITAIDDNEFATLKLLLEELFPAYTHETVVVNHHPQGSGGANVSATHEYAIVTVPKGKNLFMGQPVGKRIEVWSLIKAGAGRDYYRVGRPNMFFALHIDKTTGFAVDIGPQLDVSVKYPTDDTKEGYKRVYPLDKKGNERRWRYGRPTMLNLIKQNRIKGSLPKFSMKVVMPRDDSYQPLYSNWTNSRYNAGPHGTALLKNIIPKTTFPFPKSLNTVLDFIAGATRLKKEAIVLDFFAGSGTTGHAVLELNKQDGKKRSFILCTNNENGIAEDVCFPRIRNVIKGYKYTGEDRTIVYETKLNKKILSEMDLVISNLEKIKNDSQNKYDNLEVKIEDNSIRLYGIIKTNGNKDGLGGNLKYFKTEFVDYKEITDSNKLKLTQEALEMLCIKEDTYDLVINKKEYKIYKNNDHYTGIILDQLSINEFKKTISNYDNIVSVYIFSLGDDSFDEEFEDIKQKVKLSPIPEAILKVYKKIFK